MLHSNKATKDCGFGSLPRNTLSKIPQGNDVIPKVYHPGWATDVPLLCAVHTFKSEYLAKQPLRPPVVLTISRLSECPGFLPVFGAGARRENGWLQER